MPAGLLKRVSWEFGCDLRPPNGFNTPYYCNRAVDRALAHAVSVFDRKARLRDYSFVQRQVLKRSSVLLFVSAERNRRYPGGAARVTSVLCSLHSIRSRASITAHVDSRRAARRLNCRRLLSAVVRARTTTLAGKQAAEEAATMTGFVC
jgi:hypothetical protein